MIFAEADIFYVEIFWLIWAKKIGLLGSEIFAQSRAQTRETKWGDNF